jgi:membrane peptidoglycan carboxypeptidase
MVKNPPPPFADKDDDSSLARHITQQGLTALVPAWRHQQHPLYARPSPLTAPPPAPPDDNNLEGQDALQAVRHRPSLSSRPPRDDKETASQNTPKDNRKKGGAKRPHSRRTNPLWARGLAGAIWLIFAMGLAWLIWLEARSSWLQSALLSRWLADSGYSLGPGPAPRRLKAPSGPYDQRLGYSALAGFLENLREEGYGITSQARASDKLLALAQAGIFPPYPEKAGGGLKLLDRAKSPLYEVQLPQRFYKDFAEIPPLLTQTLLFIENRELLEERFERRNPAVEWDRFALAITERAWRFWRQDDDNSPGASTLATQLEKFRHSPGGQTDGVVEKLRQMVSASLRSYTQGPLTLRHRQFLLQAYLNSTPLGARPQFGEIYGIGDGLFAWYGTDFAAANDALKNPAFDETALLRQAYVFRQLLSLLLAQRRPAYYLQTNPAALDPLVESHLDLLLKAGIITPALRDAAKGLSVPFQDALPPPVQTDFALQKPVLNLRTKLLTLLGGGSLYDLDRYDVTARTSLDVTLSQTIGRALRTLQTPEGAGRASLLAPRLLDQSDPAGVTYGFTLYEAGKEANFLRIDADTLNQPLNVNEGGKLDLGSTAKLRTLVSYLDIIATLYDRYAHFSPPELAAAKEGANDPLTRWVVDELAQKPQAKPSKAELLAGAMQRRYSASPAEAFFTGGGVHRFANFDTSYDTQIIPLYIAFRHSVNLPFIRLMRDIISFYREEGEEEGQALLQDPSHPRRQEYLERFAVRETRLDLLASRIRPRASTLSALYRFVKPQEDVVALARFLAARIPKALPNADAIEKLYERYAPGKFTLADMAYIIGVHPLELWLVGYWQQAPNARLSEILLASRQQRLESYEWLFKARSRQAQNTRIRILLEEQAFARLHQRWRVWGYPFENLIPSLATAIGSSADRPEALAELAGILANNGVKKPSIVIDDMHWAQDTPYEVMLAPQRGRGRQLLDEEAARVVKAAMQDVVENGTAKRALGAFVDGNGQPLLLGAKTGTGDNRLERFKPDGTVSSSRVVSRSASLVFVLEDRFFGVLTAYVTGDKAAEYRFTSALPAQILHEIAPLLAPLLAQPRV